jgi:Domain of unknown function (DUF5666)
MIKLKRHYTALAIAGLATSLFLAACGGGTGSTAGSASSTPTASDSAVGSISGFGSVIVNGVRYDDSSSTVADDTGASRATSSLGLGMMVEVKGLNNDDGSGSASAIIVFSEAQGPISNLSSASGTFSLLGLSVSTSASTVYSGVAGAASLANSNNVEVYGLRSGNTIAASRIELKTPAAGATLVKIRGAISGLSTSASTFTVGNTTVNFAGATVTPSAAALVDGVFVKISSSSLPTAGVVTANKVHVIGARQFAMEHGARSEVEGLVSGYQSISNFTIAGVTVDATNATFLRGTAAALANGARLEIKGTVTNGVLIARLVKFEDASGTDSFELHGAVSTFTSLSNFVVRGVTVDASASTVLFERGVAADVAAGRALEVEGSMETTASGSILKASKIKFEDAPTAGAGSVAGELEFRGRLTSVTGNTLVVGTRTVTVNSSTVYRRLTLAQLVAGAMVEVRGVVQTDGSVIASRISSKD